MEQLTFTSLTTAHRNDPVTSFEAADLANLKGHGKKYKAFIVDLLKRFDRIAGFTAGELAYKAASLMPVNERETYYNIQRVIHFLKNEGTIRVELTRRCTRRKTTCRAWRINK